VLAGHALPLHATALLVILVHPVGKVFCGAVYRQLVAALYGLTELYVPPVGLAPVNDEHSFRANAPPLVALVCATIASPTR
jgi:hypothetical protein